MANLRELRDRIRSVNSTKKITKAQELIATSRITKAQARVEASQPYATEMTSIMNKLASASTLEHDMLREREDGNVAAILVVTSDRGMCGGYNKQGLRGSSVRYRQQGHRPLQVPRGRGSWQLGRFLSGPNLGGHPRCAPSPD